MHYNDSLTKTVTLGSWQQSASIGTLSKMTVFIWPLRGPEAGYSINQKLWPTIKINELGKRYSLTEICGLFYY